MKLIIQVPCFNEEQTLALALAQLPRAIEGVDEVEVLVIDDGSDDRTAEVAREAGADHVVSHQRNLGLARAFSTGLMACLERGADIIVNTDADNQYCADDIPRLIEPILDGRADMVIGTRPIESIDHFHQANKALHHLGSWVVRKISGVPVGDAPSGFRAMTRRTAMKLNVFSSYTYTLETIIQAGQGGLAVESVPIRVNEDLRPSRLVKSITSYIRRSIMTMLRIFVAYRPFPVFISLGGVLIFFALVLGVRFLVLLFMGEGEGHVQSLILTAILFILGFNVCMLGVISDIISVNRKLLEDIQYQVRQVLLGKTESRKPKAKSGGGGASGKKKSKKTKKKA
jgi:glycosyltransferase involved in cell wall biosynthesis